MNQFVIIIVVCILINFQSVAISSEWQKTLNSTFDWVEIWDEYQEWNPNNTSKYAIKNFDLDGTNYHGPVFSSDGALSGWDTYTDPSFSIPLENRDKSIKAWDSSKVVTGKSASFSHNGDQSISTYTGNTGPHTVKRYFGDGNPQTGQDGYDEVYIFFRAYIPRQMFPTVQPGGASGLG